MSRELSLVELDAELSAELPERALMRRVHAHARHGSVANANSTSQHIRNGQTALVLGTTGTTNALILQGGGNSNSNSNTQFGVPVNFHG